MIVRILRSSARQDWALEASFTPKKIAFRRVICFCFCLFVCLFEVVPRFNLGDNNLPINSYWGCGFETSCCILLSNGCSRCHDVFTGNTRSAWNPWYPWGTREEGKEKFFFLNKIISDINSWRKQLFTSSSRVRKDFRDRLGVMVTKDREEDLDREEPQETADRKEMRWTGT